MPAEVGAASVVAKPPPAEGVTVFEPVGPLTVKGVPPGKYEP
ncbi:MAG TPA: hypothetical protein VGR11_12655 [Solirubrobacteraceae bacterium]|nr:hypothetical protein [Solirubrobacteraceae bacterium]